MTHVSDQARESVTRGFEQSSLLTGILESMTSPIERILFRELLTNLYLEGYLDAKLEELSTYKEVQDAQA